MVAGWKSAPSDQLIGPTSSQPSTAPAPNLSTAVSFGVRRGFTDQEIAFFLNVDFVNHVALVAVVEEGGYPTIVGGGRYVVVQPGTAEVAFAVVDEYQGQGIGAALMRHLAAIARRVEVKQFIAEVLPDNNPMLKVFEKSGFRLSTRRESNTVHVTLQLL